MRLFSPAMKRSLSEVTPVVSVGFVACIVSVQLAIALTTIGVMHGTFVPNALAAPLGLLVGGLALLGSATVWRAAPHHR